MSLVNLLSNVIGNISSSMDETRKSIEKPGPKRNVAIVAGSAICVATTLAMLFANDVRKHRNAKCPMKYKPIDPDTVPAIKEKRKNILKDRFKPGVTEIPEEIDYIVIGSGIGGLSCAAALSKVGRRCLVLEQHDRLGGCMHVWSKGYAFDVGIHYVGKAHKYQWKLNALMCDESDKVEFACNGSKEDGFTYDRFLFGMKKEKRVEVMCRKNRRWEDLYSRYTRKEDHDALDRFQALMKEAQATMLISMVCRLFSSQWFRKTIHAFGRWKYPRVYGKTVREVLDESVFTSKYFNPTLAMDLTANIGDMGGKLSDAPFAMMVAILDHYQSGGYYFKDGPTSVTKGLMRTIESVGGRSLANARVSSLIFDDGLKKGTRVIGVKVVARNGKEYEFLSKRGVISDAGFLNTFTKILPYQEIERRDLASESFVSTVKRIIEETPPSPQHLQVFLGFSKPQSELNLPGYNTWFMGYDEVKSGNGMIKMDYDDLLENFYRDPLHAPMMGFIGFPSAKDPKYNETRPGKSTCVIVTEVPFRLFERWQSVGKPKGRGSEGADYNAFKKAIAQRFIDFVHSEWPQTQGVVDKVDVGTALTAQFYLGSPQGESYGLSHSLSRFYDCSYSDVLRPKTPVSGLYLTGQDVTTAGWAGAFSAGLMTAETALSGYHSLSALVSGRTLIKDLCKVSKFDCMGKLY